MEAAAAWWLYLGCNPVTVLLTRCSPAIQTPSLLPAGSSSLPAAQICRAPTEAWCHQQAVLGKT